MTELPVPAAIEESEIGKDDGLIEEQFEAYREAYKSFYDIYGGEDYEDPIKLSQALKKVNRTRKMLPKYSDAARNLAVKFYQLVSVSIDLRNTREWEEIRNSPDEDGTVYYPLCLDEEAIKAIYGNNRTSKVIEDILEMFKDHAPTAKKEWLLRSIVLWEDVKEGLRKYLNSEYGISIPG